jgi:hypothetical protein
MNSIIKNLALCAILGGAGSALAAPVLIPNGDFSAGSSLWTENNCCGSYVYNYPGTGGNPDGYGIIDNSGGGGYGIWIANGNSVISLASLGLTAGKAYTFSQDMITLTPGGGNKAGVKIESWGPSGYISDSGDLRAATESAAWANYTFSYTIAAGATSIKVVPLWAPNASIGYDNFKVDNTPAVVQPVIPNGAFEIPGGVSWAFFQGGGQTVSYPATGGNPNGCAVIDSVGLGAYAVMVANNNASMSLASLGLTAGQTYTFQQDMKILSGTSIGGLKVEFVPTGTGDMYPAIIGDGSQWATYSFQVTIPPTCTQIQVVPLWGPNSQVAYDNFKILLPPPPAAPIATIKTGTLVGWTAASAVNTYQAQSSPDNSDWTNVGPVFTGNTVTGVFDALTAPFYQVLETTPATPGNAVLNPGFEDNDISTTPANNWMIAPQFNATATTVGSYAAVSPHGGAKMLQLDAQTSGGGTPAEVGVRSNNFIAVTAGTAYNLSFYATNQVTGASFVLGAKLRYYNDFSVEIGLSSETDFGNVGAAWTQVNKAFTTPSGTAYVKIDFFLRSGAVPSVQWVALIDDVTLITPLIPGDSSVIAATAVPGVEVSWKTLTGSNYQVSTSGNLSGWSDFGGSITGNGAVWSIVDALTPPKKFYRILQTTP